MNKYISSSETKDDADMDSYMVDTKPVSYEGEVQRLKCENFQLRLSCYNYECTMNQIENDTKDNEVAIIKQSYEKKIQNCHLIENRMKLIEKENMDVKEKLKEYEDLKVELSPHDNECQVSEPCTFCDNNGWVLKKTIDELAQKITELEDDNLRLQNFLLKAKASIVKKDSLEVGCNTEMDTRNSLYNGESLSDLESDTPPSSPVIQLPLEILFQTTLTKINDFLSKYKTGEMKIRKLETAMLSALQHDCPPETITDDNFKSCLFKDHAVTPEDRYIDSMIQKCHVQLINSDQQQMDSLISDCDEESHESPPIDKVSHKNPNILAINSILEKLNKRNKSIQILRKKMKMNKTWNKHVSTFQQAGVKSELQSDTREEIEIYIEQITELTSRLTTMIPGIKNTFAKSMDHIKKIRMFQMDTDYNSMVEYHQHIERSFLDGCNMFIQSTSSCLLALNKEKMFISSACQFFSSITVDSCGPVDIRVVTGGHTSEEKIPPTPPFIHDKATSIDPLIPCHAINQTIDLQPTLQMNMQVLHRSIQTIMPEDDDRKHFQGTRPSSRKSSDTFTIDEFENDTVQMGGPRNIRACGDVVSEEVPIKFVELQKNERYIFKDFAAGISFQGRNDVYNLRRCTSLNNVKTNEVASLEPSLSLTNLNNSNLDHNSCLYHEIFNVKDDTASSSISPSNRQISATKIHRTFSSHSSRMTCCSPSLLPSDANKANECNLPHLKQRIMKFVYVHDCRKYIQAMSKRDLLITEEISIIDNTSTKCDFCSKLKFEIGTYVERWKNEVLNFRDTFLKCSVLSKALFMSSDVELVQSLFVQRESTIDLVLPDGDLYKNDSTMFASLKALIEDTDQSYEALDRLYEYILEKTLLLRFHVKDSCISNSDYVLNDLQRRICELTRSEGDLNTENRELLDRIRRINIDNEELERDKSQIQMELNQEISARKSMKEMIEKIVDDRDDIARENKALLQERQEKKEELCMLEMEIRIHKENNQMYKEASSKLAESEATYASLERENIVIKEHEKQLLNESMDFKNTLANREEKIAELTSFLSYSKTEISDQNLLLKHNENKYNNEIKDLENTIKRMSRDSMDWKEKICKLEQDSENKFNLFSNERVKSKELKLKCQSVEEELNDTKMDLYGRKQELRLVGLRMQEIENFKGSVGEVKEKFDRLTNTIIDFVVNINATVTKDSLTLQYVENQALYKNEMEEIKTLGVISDAIDVLLKVLEQQIKISKDQTGKTHSRKENKCTQVNLKNKIEEKVNYGKEGFKESRERKRSDNSACLPKLCDATPTKSMEFCLKQSERTSKIQISPSGAQIDSDLSGLTFASNDRCPIPAPRQKSRNPPKICLCDQVNENNIKNTISMPPVCGGERNGDQDEDAEHSSLYEDRDNTSQISEHLTLTLDAKEGNHILGHDHGTLDIGLVDTSCVIQTLLLRIRSGISPQYTREFRDLCHEIKLIEFENSASSTAQCNGPLSALDKGSIEKLIDTNRCLTNNLMKTTKKLLDSQDKVEVLNSEVRQGQIRKHEMSIELASKYQQVSQIQLELDNLKGEGMRPICLEQNTQTIPHTENIGHGGTNSKMDEFLTIADPELDQRENICSRQSENTLSKSEDISQISKSNNLRDRPDNGNHINHHFDGDWDDVTRTMIRCLTTLSEVQESLVTPPPGDDPLVMPTYLHTLRCEADSNTDSAFHRTARNTSSTNGIIKDSDRILVALIKENKYQTIRHIILKIKDYFKALNEGKREESEVSKTFEHLVHVERSVVKINTILSNNVVIRELSNSDWQRLLDDKELHNVYPLESTMTNLYPANDPLDATERVQSDIVRLQQRLERYQCRYKNLKNAVMANKYNFNGSDIGHM